MYGRGQEVQERSSAAKRVTVSQTRLPLKLTEQGQHIKNNRRGIGWNLAQGCRQGTINNRKHGSCEGAVLVLYTVMTEWQGISIIIVVGCERASPTGRRGWRGEPRRASWESCESTCR